MNFALWLENLNVNWVVPNFNEEADEINRTAVDLSLNRNKLFHALKDGQLVDLSNFAWSKMANTDSWGIQYGDMRAVHELARQYGRNAHKIFEALEHGGTLPAPIVLQNPLYLIAGNTRLMAAKAFGVKPKVFMISMDS